MSVKINFDICETFYVECACCGESLNGYQYEDILKIDQCKKCVEWKVEKLKKRQSNE